ncbi:MAG: hypothetical protein D3905_12615, partial [Candidatus Electrothrix sp. AS4_5]|nr:hypothetical protein [Candidatus Electrothrix gigas]
MPANFIIQILFGTALLLLTSITAAASPAQYMAFQKLALYKYDAENKYYLALHSIDDSTDIKNIDLDNLHILLKKKDGGKIEIDRKDLIILPLGDMYSKWDAQYTYFQFNLVIDTSGSIEDSDLQTVENIVSRFVTRIPSPFKGQVIKFSSAITKSS